MLTTAPCLTSAAAAAAAGRTGGRRGRGSVRPAQAAVPAACPLQLPAGGRGRAWTVPLLRRHGCFHKALHGGDGGDRRP